MQDKLHHLTHKVFVGNSEGRELLELLKEKMTSVRIFPADPMFIERHGGATGYANFVEGQKTFLDYIDNLISEYENSINHK